jgi:hypothetical protein
MKRILLSAIVLAAAYNAMAQTYVPVAVTGYNADIVANGSGSAATSTSINADDGGFVLMAQNYVTPSNQSPTSFLPNSGLINSAATPGVTYQLAAYTGNNSLRIPATGTGTAAGTGTITFSSPFSAEALYVLGFSGSGISTVTITVTFTDATTQVFSGQSFSDWFGGTGFAIQGIGRVGRTTNVIENSTIDPRIYQKVLTLSAGNITKPIQSIAFNKTSATGVLNIMGVTIKTPPSTLAIDAGVSAITAPNTSCNLGTTETITVAVTNFGTTPQSNIPVSYTVNGGTAVNEVMAGPVPANTTTPYSFTTKANLSTVNTYNIVARTTVTGDLLATNDSFTKAVSNTGATAVPIITPSGPTALCTGGTVVLTAASTTTGATYAWFINGQTIPNANGATYTASAIGTYTVTAAAGGCTATSAPTTVTVNSIPPTPTISRAGNVLTSSGLTGNQWYKNGAILTGETNKTYTATANGAYTVKVTTNGCTSSTSSTMNVTNILGISEDQAGLKVAVFPNPSEGLFNLSLPKGKAFAITVTDLAGKIVKQQTANDKTAILDLRNEAKGIYLLKIESEGKTATRKLILE